MRRLNDPRQQQPALFDPYRMVFSDLAYDVVRGGWQGVFRHVILALLPAPQLAKHFHATIGRPTKEVYSMAGLILIQEFHGWSAEEAVQGYMFRSDLQYALNLEPGLQSLCTRTLERYLELFHEDELAQAVMEKVTMRLAEVLEVNVQQQRLDSTHVFSNMATFGRTRLMGVTSKRFLTQVKRHAPEKYAALPEALRQRYAPAEQQLFGAAALKDQDSRARARQQVAEDMRFLVDHFADDAAFQNRPSYQTLVKVFQQQCVVEEDRVAMKKKTGGDCVQNPSDPDATYDGKKGPGYQVQLAETCNPDNEVQLITAALPQTAVESDAHAVAPVLAQLQKQALLPKEMMCDTAYASDDNVQTAAALGVDLVGPVAGAAQDTARLNADDFPVNEETHQVECCPAGRIPLETVHDAEQGTLTVRMSATECAACRFRDECPVQKRGDHFEARFTDKERRLDERRREEETPAFRERYRRRAGIESTNSGLKRRLRLGRLRVRGRPAVFHSLRLKIAGWNILRAAASTKMRKIVAERAAQAGAPAFSPPLLSFWQRLRPILSCRKPAALLGYGHTENSRPALAA